MKPKWFLTTPKLWNIWKMRICESSSRFFNDIRRTEEQLAVFGELSFDLVPNTLEVILELVLKRSE